MAPTTEVRTARPRPQSQAVRAARLRGPPTLHAQPRERVMRRIQRRKPDQPLGQPREPPSRAHPRDLSRQCEQVSGPTRLPVESHRLTNRVGQSRDPTQQPERIREATNLATRIPRQIAPATPHIRAKRPRDLPTRAARTGGLTVRVATTLDPTEPATESIDVTRFQTGARRRGLCTWERLLMTGISGVRKARSSPGITRFGPGIGGQPSGDAGSALTLKLAPTTTTSRPLVPTPRLKQSRRTASLPRTRYPNQRRTQTKSPMMMMIRRRPRNHESGCNWKQGSPVRPRRST